MAKRDATMHGNAPDESTCAVLVVDVLNDLDFPGGAGIDQEPGD